MNVLRHARMALGASALVAALAGCAGSGAADTPAVPPAFRRETTNPHAALRARVVFVVLPDYAPGRFSTGGDDLDLPAHFDRRRLFEEILARHPAARFYHTGEMDIAGCPTTCSGKLLLETATGPVGTDTPWSIRFDAARLMATAYDAEVRFTLADLILPDAGLTEVRSRTGETAPITSHLAMATDLTFAGRPIVCGGVTYAENHYAVRVFAEVRRSLGGPARIPGLRGDADAWVVTPIPVNGTDCWIRYERYSQVGLDRDTALAVIAVAKLTTDAWLDKLPPAAHASRQRGVACPPIGLAWEKPASVCFDAAGLGETSDLTVVGGAGAPRLRVTAWADGNTPPAPAAPVPAGGMPFAPGDVVVSPGAGGVFATIYGLQPTETPCLYRNGKTGLYAVNLVRLRRVPAP